MSESVENRYVHSKLYKLVDQVEGYYYIGSTACQTLSKRLMWHKQDSSKPKFQKIKKYVHFNSVGWTNVKIILISEHKFQNKMELLREEDKLIQENRNDPKCLNVIRAFMSDEDKKAYYTEHNKEYRENHGDELRKKDRERNLIRFANKEKTKCECGLLYINCQLKLHQNRPFHIAYMKYKNGEIDKTKYTLCDCGAITLNRCVAVHLSSYLHLKRLKQN